MESPHVLLPAYLPINLLLFCDFRLHMEFFPCKRQNQERDYLGSSNSRPAPQNPDSAGSISIGLECQTVTFKHILRSGQALRIFPLGISHEADFTWHWDWVYLKDNRVRDPLPRWSQDGRLVLVAWLAVSPHACSWRLFQHLCPHVLGDNHPGDTIQGITVETALSIMTWQMLNSHFHLFYWPHNFM